MYNDKKDKIEETIFHRWIELLKVFKDSTLIELIYQDMFNNREENFYECLFYSLDSSEDFKEYINSTIEEEEPNENPFNQFYGICDVKPSQVKMENPSVFHLNKKNTDGIFTFLVKALYQLDKEYDGTIDREKLKEYFVTNFNFTVLKEISFLININDNINSNDKPFNIYALILTLEILSDLFGDQITHLNVGFTDYFFDFFNLEKGNEVSNRIFFSDLYLAYVCVFLFFFKIKTKKFNPFMNSVGLSISIFNNHPDIIEPFTFNCFLFENFLKKGGIEKEKIHIYDLIKLIKSISISRSKSKIEDVDFIFYNSLNTFTELEINIYTKHSNVKKYLTDLFDLNKSEDSKYQKLNLFYQNLKLSLLENVYEDKELFDNLLINKIKTNVRNFSLNLLPCLVDSGIPTEKNENFKEIEIDLNKILGDASYTSAIRTLSLQGNNIKIKSTGDKISSLHEFYFFPNNIFTSNISFVYNYTHLSHLTLRNLNLENFEILSSNWKNFSSLKSADLSVKYDESNTNSNERTLLSLYKFLVKICELNFENLGKLEKLKIFVENKNVLLEEEVCRSFIYLMSQVFSIIYFSLIYRLDFDSEKSKSNVTSKKILQEIKKQYGKNKDEIGTINEKIFQSQDKNSFLYISENDINTENNKKIKPKNELIPIGRWKIDEFVNLFYLINSLEPLRPLKRSPILVKFFHFLAKPIKNRIFYIENYN
jgi:hypothetical protein